VKARPLSGIENQFREKKILPLMEEACKRHLPSIEDAGIMRIKRGSNQTCGERKAVEVVTRFSYAQGLQYGNMGCGYACAMNQQKFFSGEFNDKKVQEGDRKTRTVRFFLHFTVIKI